MDRIDLRLHEPRIDTLKLITLNGLPYIGFPYHLLAGNVAANWALTQKHDFLIRAIKSAVNRRIQHEHAQTMDHLQP